MSPSGPRRGTPAHDARMRELRAVLGAAADERIVELPSAADLRARAAPDPLDRRIAEETRPVRTSLAVEWVSPDRRGIRGGVYVSVLARQLRLSADAADALLGGAPERARIRVGFAGRRLVFALAARAEEGYAATRLKVGQSRQVVLSGASLMRAVRAHGYAPGMRVPLVWDADHRWLVAEPMRDKRGETA
ncbi:MAG: hypothetical protein QJR08_03675 [Bacillota bacterium]|nr:hypothetical protein [Bacillota bacterium]